MFECKLSLAFTRSAAAQRAAITFLLVVFLTCQCDAQMRCRVLCISGEKPYAHSNLREVPGMRCGAVDMFEALCTLPSVDDQSSKLMTSSGRRDLRPTVPNVTHQVRLLMRHRPENEMTIVFASVHVALTKVKTEKGRASRLEPCLILEDAPMSLHEFGRLLVESGSGPVLLILDCCRPTGTTFESLFPDSSELKRRVAVLFSVQPESVATVPYDESSAFVEAVLRTINPYREEDDFETGITFDRFFRGVRDLSRKTGGQTATWNLSEPDFGQHLFFYADAKRGSKAASSQYAQALDAFLKDHLDGAETIVRESLKAAPSHPRLLNLLGLILSRQARLETDEVKKVGLFRQALAAYERVWSNEEAAATFPVIYSNRAECLLSLNEALGSKAPSGWKDETHRAFLESLSHESGSAFAYNNAARYAERILEKFDEADLLFRKGMAIDPSNALCQFNYGVFSLKRYVALKPTNPTVARKYLREAPLHFEATLRQKQDDRYGEYLYRTADWLAEAERFFVEEGVTTRLDWRRLFDRATDMAYFNESVRHGAINTYVARRSAEYTSATRQWCLDVRSGREISPRALNTWPFIQRFYQRSLQGADWNGTLEAAHGVALDKRRAFPIAVYHASLLLYVANDTEKAGIALPSAKEFGGSIADWRGLKQQIFRDLAIVAMNSFHTGETGEKLMKGSPGWDYVIASLPNDDDLSAAFSPRAWLLLTAGRLQDAEAEQREWEKRSNKNDTAFWNSWRSASAAASQRAMSNVVPDEPRAESHPSGSGGPK